MSTETVLKMYNSPLNSVKKVIDRLKWEFKFIMNRNGVSYLSSTGRRYSVNYRKETSDKKVLLDIFYSKAYSFENLKRYNDIKTMYDTILAENKIPLIIDAGANIGASTIWFKDQFPKSHLIAIEPEDNNFNILKKNTGKLGVECKHQAIGSINSHALISNSNLSENWGFQTEYDSTGPIQVRSISTIIEESPANDLKPFIIKIDIEGFEADLFSKDTEWIDQFYVIIIELHDWMLPKQGSSKNFLSAIAGKNRDFIQKGENIFSIRN